MHYGPVPCPENWAAPRSYKAYILGTPDGGPNPAVDADFEEVNSSDYRWNLAIEATPPDDYAGESAPDGPSEDPDSDGKCNATVTATNFDVTPSTIRKGESLWYSANVTCLSKNYEVWPLLYKPSEDERAEPYYIKWKDEPIYTAYTLEIGPSVSGDMEYGEHSETPKGDYQLVLVRVPPGAHDDIRRLDKRFAEAHLPDGVRVFGRKDVALAA
jgi:hypothetical protein